MVEAYKDHDHKESIQDENRMLYRVMPIVGAISLGLWIVIVLVVLSAMND